MKAQELMGVLETNPTQKFYDDIVFAFSLQADKAKDEGEWSVPLRIMLPEKGRLETSNPVHFTPDNSVTLDEVAANLTGYLTFNGYRCTVEFEPVFTPRCVLKSRLVGNIC